MERSQLMLLQASEEIKSNKSKYKNRNKGDQSAKVASISFYNQLGGQVDIDPDIKVNTKLSQITPQSKKVERSRSSSPNEEIIGVCNGIFAALMSNTWLLEKFIYQKKQNHPDAQMKKKDSVLANYLVSINEIMPFLNSSFYKSAIDQLAKQVKERIDKIWTSLSPDEHLEYAQIVSTLRSKTFKNKTMSKFNNSEMDGKDMFVLDVMAHFMRRNREYEEYCTKSTMRSIISKKTMQLFFGQSENYKECWDKFVGFEEWLYFDFQYEFHELITITSIVQLKNRIVHNSYRCSKEKNKANTFIKIGKLKFEERLLSNKEEDQGSKLFKYKFCQLVFTSFGNMLSVKGVVIRSQISIKLSDILSISSENQQSKEFLNIKYDYCVTLDSLKAELDRMKQVQAHKKDDDDEIITERCLSQLEWRYLASRKLPLKITKINLKRYTQYTSYEKLTMKKICEIALNRVKILEKVTNIYLQLQKSAGRKPIYIFRFLYSYNQIIRAKKEQGELQKDISVEAIIAFNETDCTLICSARQQLSFHAYSKFIRKLFALKKFNNYFLVLYEFNLKKRIPWSTYIDLNNYLQKVHSSHVYVSTNKDLFRNHIAMVSYIYSCLIAKNISQQTFYLVFDKILQEIAKMLKKTEKRSHNKSLGQYLPYSRSLLPKPREIYSDKVVDVSSVNQTDEYKSIFLSSIRATKIVYQQPQGQDAIQTVEGQAYVEPPATAFQHYQKQSELISGQGEQSDQFQRQTITRRFHFEDFIQQMLNDKITRFSILNDMIYQPFSYIFVLQGYLQSLSEAKLSQSEEDKIAIIGMINDGQNHQMTKYCHKDKQTVIKNIFKTKYSRQACDILVRSCIQSSQDIRTSNKLFYKKWILEQTKFLTFQDNQDISYLLKHIKEKEGIYSEIYK